MQTRKTWALLSVASIASMVIAACAPTTTTVIVTAPPVIQTQVVKVEVETTKIVTEIQTVVAPTEAAALSFTTPHPILGDLRVRQAIAHCADRASIIASVYPFVADQSVLLMDAFVPKSHWAYTAPSTQYPFDVEAGGKLLDEAGWKLGEGATFRTNEAGDEFALKFTTTAAAFRQTWAAVFEKNMATCGMRVLRFHVPAAYWFGDTTGVARRDYELGAFAWVGTADPGGATLYGCNVIPRPENGWAGQNAMGWCNETASVAINAANNTLSRDERIKQYAIFHEEFAKDLPSLPMFNRAEVLATAKDLVGFAPAPGEPYYVYNINEWEIPGKDTIVIAFSQEPASLFTLVEDAYVAAVAARLVYGSHTSSLNYDFAAILYKSLPTLENGGAVVNEVDVKEGDMVVDVTGEVVELKAGVKVKDASGAEVEFASGTVKMQQMVVTASFLDGIAWSDGTPLTKADIELSDKIVCDKESGATSFFLCDRTAAREYVDDTTVIYTVVPGFLDPTYFVDFTPGAYPSARVISAGGTLGEAAASTWATLPEMSESPLGYGPYKITGWTKGQEMSFEANAGFVLGAPKTANVIIQFVADTNAAVAALLAGDADVLGSETLGAGAEVATVIEAADKVTSYVQASATWEHIDFALFIK